MSKRIAGILVGLFLLGCEAPAPEAPAVEVAVDWSSVIRSANEALLGQGQFERVDEFFTEEYGGEGGRERLRDFIADIRKSFPDLQVEVEILVQDGDQVAWVRRLRGTHQEDYDDIAATGEEVSWRSMVVSRIEGGRIAEETSVTNMNGALRSR